MRQLFFKFIFFPLDLIYLTLDSCIITWRKLKSLFRKKKTQRCHFCQGESNHEDMRSVRSVLKYQNKWMVKLLSSCIRFKSDGRRTVGFCRSDNGLTSPPAWAPLLCIAMISFWLGGTYFILKSLSSDPDNFGKNFISTFSPSSLGEDEEEFNFLDQDEVRLNPERAERYFLSGLRFFDQQNFPSAQVDFKISIQSNPTDPETHYHLAKSYLAMGQIVQGEASIRKTLEFDPEHVDALLILAELMERRENRPEALSLAKKALELAPENLKALRLNAGLSASVGDKEVTRELMDKLYLSAANDPELLTFLGRLERSVFQNIEASKTRLNAALALKENHIPALLGMISIWVQENDIAKVDSTLAKILELDPDNLPALRMQAELILNRFGIPAGLRAYNQLLGRFGGNMGLRLRYAELLLRAGKISEGKKLAQQLSASRVPQYERSAHWMLANLYSQVRMYEEAVQHARSVLRLTPNGLNIHLFLSQQLLALEQYGEARREAESALALNRQDIRAINLLSQSMILSGGTQEAVELLDTLVEEFPENDGLRNRRIQILMQSDNWLDALSDLEILIDKYPNNDELKNNLAFLYARSGQNLDRAREISESLIAKFPENATILDTHAYVLASSGNHEEALKVYEKALSLASNNVIIRYHYAKSLSATNQNSEAIRQLEALFMINPDFPQSTEARNLLTSLQGERPADEV